MPVVPNPRLLCQTKEKMSITLSDGLTVRERLLAMQADSNKEFTRRLHPGVENILGLRVPALRQLAAEIARCDWRRYLEDPGSYYMEERMLHGMVLGKIRIDNTDTYLEMVGDFVKRINSWSVCDTFDFSGGRKFVDKNSDKIFEWLRTFIDSEAEYSVRFGVVMLLKYYINDCYLDAVEKTLGSISHTGYYVSMAVAWTIAEILIKYPDRGTAWLHTRPVDAQTMRRAIQKAIESYRIDPARKELLRKFRATQA